MVQATDSGTKTRALLTAAAASDSTATVVGALFDFMSTMRRRHNDSAGASVLLTRLAAAGPLRSIDLAEATGLDQSTISRYVAQLESEGLVERTTVAKDRRAHLLALTALGTTTAHDQIAAKIAFLEGVVSSWPEDDIRTFATLLERFAHGVIATEGNTPA